MDEDDVFVHLNEAQLRELAELICGREQDAMRKITWPSENEYGKHYDESTDAYDCAVGILNAGAALMGKFKNDGSNNDNLIHLIIHYINGYIGYALDTALQGMRHSSMRKKYLGEIMASVDLLTERFDAMNADSDDFVAKAESLAEEAEEMMNEMLKYSRKFQTSLSGNSSNMLSKKRLTFEGLVEQYKQELYPEFDGEFVDLEVIQKKQVYDRIIEESGGGDVTSESKGGPGALSLMYTAATVAFHIYTSENKVETSIREIVSTGISVGFTYIGDFVEAAMAEWLVIEATSWFVLSVGFIVGSGGAYLIGLCATALMDWCFHTGGKAQVVTSFLKTDQHKCYYLEMPDGLDLASEIAYRDRAKN